MATLKTTAPPTRYIDIKQAAAFMHRTEKAMYAAVARRRIPFRRDGRILRFSQQELDEFMRRLDGVSVDEAVERTLNHGLRDAG